MSICVIEGLKDGAKDCNDHPRYEGIPRHSKVVVLALPKMHLVIEEADASKVIAKDLDPGKYRVTVGKFQELDPNGMCYSYDFYHDCDEEMFKKIGSMKPQHTKIMNTSEGPRWRCKILNCDNDATSQFGAVKHWATHFGVDVEAAIRENDQATLAKLNSGSATFVVDNSQEKALRQSFLNA